MSVTPSYSAAHGNLLNVYNVLILLIQEVEVSDRLARM